MNGLFFRLAIALTAVGLVVQVVQAQEQYPLTQVPREEIVGVALFPDGVTPIVNLPIRVWSVDKQRMLYRSRTDDDGIFRIPPVRAGNCYIFVGRVRVNLQILTSDELNSSQHHDLVVILPYRMLTTSRPTVEPIIFAPLLVPIVPWEPKQVSP